MIIPAELKYTNPELVNEDPYGAGWMIKIELEADPDLSALLASDAYETHIG